MRILDVNGVLCICADSESARAESGFSAARESTGECRSVDLAMWARAMESAPPMSVVGVDARSASVVDLSSLSRFERIAFSTIVNGRYLFGFSIMGFSLVTPFISTSPFPSTLVAGVRPFGVGYSHSARCVCEAMTATSFLLPEARCALMKTRRLAMAEESGRVEARWAQAWGFVSRTIARRDGGGARLKVSFAYFALEVYTYCHPLESGGLCHQWRSW